MIMMAVVLWLTAPFIIKIMTAKGFHGASKYMLWISLGYASFGMYRLISYPIVYSKKNYYFAYTTFSAGVVALVANYLLIKANGPIGAAQATFIAYTTSFLLTWWVANKLYPMPWLSVFKLHAWKEFFEYLRSHKW